MYEKSLNDKKNFLQNGLKEYSIKRNFDFGPTVRSNTSNLSKYISHRIINEYELVNDVLKDHSFKSTEKFIQEIFWRVYWKGWLEHRPKVWADFLLAKPNYDKQCYEDALNSNTGIECFDDWVDELKNENYLHNHTRMWFASIWIFTLNLPWQLGARFFMKHLFDGDAASNTLSWRWVAGIQTKGKNYIARSSNIKKFTNNRYSNIVLNEDAASLEDDKFYEIKEIKNLYTSRKNESLVLFESDLSIFQREDLFNSYENIYLLLLENEERNIKLSENTLNFKKNLLESFKEKVTKAEFISSSDFLSLNPNLDIIYPSVGENMDFLKRSDLNTDKLHLIARKEDLFCWQFAKKGFFNFKKNIPSIIKFLSHKGNLLE